MEALRVFVRSTPLFRRGIFSLFFNLVALAAAETRTPASRRAAVPAPVAGSIVLLRDGTASSRRGGEEREDGGLGHGLHAGKVARERSGGGAVVGDAALVGARGE